MASFRIPTLREIMQAAKDAVVGLIPNAGLGDGEDYAVEAAIMAGMVWQLFGPIAYVEDQIFPDTASLENLTRHGVLKNVPRKDPAKSKGFMLITGVGGSVQGGNTLGTAPSGVEVKTDAVTTVALPAWANKNVLAYDRTKPNTVVLDTVAGMAVADPFELGGYTYVIKDLPGAGAVIIYGTFKVDPSGPPGADVVTPKAGVRCPIIASVEGISGNLAYDTAMTLAAPGVGIDVTARILELSGGDDLEDPARWARRIQEVEAERNGGGNRSQVLSWTLEVLGVDDGFIYDLFRGLGTGDVVPQGVKGARHLSLTKRNEVQNHLRPLVPTDAVPGKITMGGHDVLVTDFADLLVAIDVILTGGPGYGADWLGTLVTAAGCTTVRINTAANPQGIIVAGNRVALPIGEKLIELGEVQAVDAGGFSLVNPLSVAPGAGLVIDPGSSLHEPVRDKLWDLFQELGPGDTDPPTRYPAPTTRAPAQLSLNLLHATVRKVPGLKNALFVSPPADVTPAAKAQCVAQSFRLRFA